LATLAIRDFPREVSPFIPSRMRIEKTSRPAATVLRPAGEIDLHTSPALRAELQTCLSEKTPCLLLDFDSVDYIDSGGLAALIEYIKGASAFSGKFGIFAVRKNVLAVFELVRLDKFFIIGTDESTTLALLGVTPAAT
jgi:anti-sigma B factor antagonist